MSPQPMSDAEIAEVVSSAFGAGSALSAAEMLLVRSIIAARDAQWAAMIGEPVAYLYHDAATVEQADPLTHSTLLMMATNRLPNYRNETPLYAIKEPK